LNAGQAITVFARPTIRPYGRAFDSALEQNSNELKSRHPHLHAIEFLHLAKFLASRQFCTVTVAQVTIYKISTNEKLTNLLENLYRDPACAQYDFYLDGKNCAVLSSHRERLSVKAPGRDRHQTTRLT
jgi:hypothetical protein